MTDLYNHIKFRYTFSRNDLLDNDGSVECEELVEQSKQFIWALTKQFIDIMSAKYVSCGIEDLDKFGEKTHLHVHIHGVTTYKVPAMRKAVTKIFKEMKELRKGNCLYSLTEVKDILDENRLLRYPFKQGRRGMGDVEWLRDLNTLPHDFEYNIQRECAIEEWERLVVVNRQKREKSLNPNQFQKFELFIETNKLEPKSIMDCCRYMDRFYLKEESSMNVKTMGGYVRTYARKIGIITEEENALKIYENV